MASIREVAKLAGVSPATVSRVINGTANVDDEDNTSKLSSKRKQFTVDDIKSNEEKTSEGKKAVNM